MSIEKIVYRVYQATKELSYVPVGKGRWERPAISEGILEDALLNDVDPILVGTYDSYRDAEEYLERKFPEIRVGDPEGMSVKYIPVYGAYIEECEIEVDDDGEECDMDSNIVRFSKYHPYVINRNGSKVDYEVAVGMMDDEIRERLAIEMNGGTEQDFFTAYEEMHEEKFGKEWELSKRCPVY